MFERNSVLRAGAFPHVRRRSRPGLYAIPVGERFGAWHGYVDCRASYHVPMILRVGRTTCSWMTEAGVEADTITYSALISVCEKAGQWQKAMEVFGWMAMKGVRPNVVTYSALISACEKGGQSELAVEAFEEMRAAGITPNLVTYNALISACAKGGRWRLALDVAKCVGNPVVQSQWGREQGSRYARAWNPQSTLYRVCVFDSAHGCAELLRAFIEFGVADAVGMDSCRSVVLGFRVRAKGFLGFVNPEP